MDEQRNEKQAQINGLKNLLEQSDHDILEAIESVFACDNLLDVPQVIMTPGNPSPASSSSAWSGARRFAA